MEHGPAQRLDELINGLLGVLDRCPYVARFRMGLWNFVCHCEGASPLDFLQHYVALNKPVDGIPEVRTYGLWLIADESRLREFQNSLAQLAPDRVLETYAEIGFLGRYSLRGGTRSVFLEQGPDADQGYCVVKDGGKVVVLCALQSGEAAEYLLRAIREIYIRETENQSGAMIHAAGVVRGSAALLLPGNKAAGKTSIALSLALSTGYDFLCNDRAVLMPHNRGLFLFPFPLPCRIGAGTIHQIPAIGRLLESKPTFRRRQSKVLKADDPESVRSREMFGSKVKLSLTPRELSRLLRLELHGGAPLETIITPMLEPERRQPILEPLSAAELAHELQRHVITPFEPKWLTPWLVERQKSVEDISTTVTSLLVGIADRTPGFRLRFGFDYWKGQTVDPRVIELVNGALQRAQL